MMEARIRHVAVSITTTSARRILFHKTGVGMPTPFRTPPRETYPRAALFFSFPASSSSMASSHNSCAPRRAFIPKFVEVKFATSYIVTPSLFQGYACRAGVVFFLFLISKKRVEGAKERLSRSVEAPQALP
jgi:hypothetical protein